MAVTNFPYITRMNSGFKVYILEGQPHLRSEDRYRHVTSDRVRLVPARPVGRPVKRKHSSELGLTLEERRERVLSKHAAAVRRSSVASVPESPSSTSTGSPASSPTLSPLACPAYAAPMLDQPLALIKKPRRQEPPPEMPAERTKTVPASQQQVRPSVITCVSSATKSNRRPLERYSHSTVVSEGSCDRVEEHFQRSLGANYYKTSSSSSSSSSASSSSSPPSTSPSSSVSVDEHFAKALGDKWLQIKGSSSTSTCGSSSPSSSSASPPGSPLFLHAQRRVLPTLAHARTHTHGHGPRGTSRPDARPHTLWVIK
ncbi:vestigial like 4 like [Sardina pilchardus]|uniref:vestigial like 4 like n=1 Tax=Sardina pilchardus TaxID=27697 RepID=UPI002E122E40